MNRLPDFHSNPHITRFNRDFYSEKDEFTYIGDGELGGKASGLAFIKDKIVSRFDDPEFKPISVNIPRLTVITTQFFDLFMKQNNLYDIAFSDLNDERIVHHFLKAELPPNLIGDLWALIEHVHLPLAVRSSSLLEDSLNEPFAGIYETKMIPNNQPDVETRFRKLAEAVKFVYASTFFNKAKCYMKSTHNSLKFEKMAVIIQEVVGIQHNKRFYPNISGVARSYNFYPTGHATPEEGVVNLALGLGKTIVDGGSVWSYSPQYPDVTPPFNSIGDLMRQSQLHFWAVDMINTNGYDPAKETEYMTLLALKDAEYDNTLTYVASTFDYTADRINIGVGFPGPRIINFGPILQVNLLPVNNVIKSVLKMCEDTFDAKVEIEFAITIELVTRGVVKAQFGMLQVRPMGLFEEMIEIDDLSLTREKVLTASDNVMGNGTIHSIKDILYVDPELFQLKNSRAIATEIETFNRELVDTASPYLLIGFGRWGTSDPWLGIPVDWGQISGARVIIESQLEGVYADLSQGSHFFHNMSNLGILYFSLKKADLLPIDWEWLKQQPIVRKGNYAAHVRLNDPVTIKVDGRKRKGVIFK